MKKLFALILLMPLALLAKPQVELLFDGEAQAPCILFLHGGGMENGASDFSDETFQHWKDKGISVAAVSMPGYGLSEGEKDFCGPSTLQALHHAIETLQSNYHPSSIGVIGFGQGALAGLLLTAERGDLAFVVAANTGYKLSHLLDEDNALRQRLLDKGYELEFTEEEIEIRSPMARVAQMHTPLFLLHKSGNSVVSDEDVRAFAALSHRFGGGCSLTILQADGLGEKITHNQVVEAAESWILERLRR